MLPLILAPPIGTTSLPPAPPPSPYSPALAVVRNDNAGTDMENNVDDKVGDLSEAVGIEIDPFPLFLIPKYALPMLPLQLSQPLLPPPTSSLSLPSSPMFPLSHCPCRRHRGRPWMCLYVPPVVSYDVILILTLTLTRTSILSSMPPSRQYLCTSSCCCSREILTSILT